MLLSVNHWWECLFVNEIDERVWWLCGWEWENVKVWELKITKTIFVTTTIQKTIQTIEVFSVKCVSEW